MRTIAAALICCLLVASLSAAAVAGTPSSPSRTGDAGLGDLAAVQPGQPDNETGPTSIEITIQPDGDARFALVKAYPASTESERAAFERLATDFENGEYGTLGYTTVETVVDDVATETGREMTLTDAGPHTAIEEGVGRLEYRFTWTNFATTTEENVTVGDGFETGEGLWLDQLEPDQRLVVRAPEGYAVAESPPGPEIDDEAVIWTGPTSFQSGDLQVTFEEAAGGSSFPTTTAAMALVGVVVVVVLVVLGWLVASRSGDRSVAARVGALLATDGTEGEEEDPSDGTTNDGGVAATQTADEGTATDSDAAPAPAPEAADSGEADAVDPELLSDGERVEHLLEENGGRMKQANIVTETGWSNAKVSQLLSRMADEGRVDKLRIGRENLITLPDVDVTEQE